MLSLIVFSFGVITALAMDGIIPLMLMRNTKKSTIFYCFSPPVMIATYIIELSLLAYTLFRYKLNSLGRLIVLALVLLATFQLAEFQVCGNSDPNFFSRLGFIAITLLPPVGLHIIQVISGRGSKSLRWLAYSSGAAFALIFGFMSQAFASYECGGNYAIFQLTDHLGGFYFTYYYAWLIIGIGLCMYYSVSATKKIRAALILQAFGYLSFLLPTGIVNAVNPTTINGIPSIMCGFAVIYALILVFGIAPRTLAKK